MFALPDLTLTHEFKPPADAKEALADLTDVKVDAVTGVWLLLSEESRRIGVCARPGDELMFHSVTEIEVHDGSGRKGFRDAVASGGGD